MGRRPFRCLTVLVAAGALATSASIPAGAAAAQPARAGTTIERFTLLTGGQMEQRTDAAGRQTIVSLSGTGHSPLLTYRLGSRPFVVPATLSPFVGRELDPALFDVASLVGAETNGAVPVVVRWHGGSRPSTPWLTGARDVSRGTTTGSITASSGAILERDLAAQPRAPGSSWSGSLRGIDSIALAGGRVTAPPAPPFLMRTLTVKGVNASGAPANGDFAIVLNTDFAPKFSAGATWFQGVLKLSVPDGHYSAVGEFLDFSSTGASIHLTIINFVVRGNTVVTIDARRSTSQISVSTPRVARDGTGGVEWQRQSAAGGGVSVGFSWSFGAGQPPTDVFVNRTPAPLVGTQSWIVSYHLDSPPKTSNPYTFDLAFESVGAIPANQHYTATRAQLATVDTRYFSDVSGRTTGEGRLSFFPDQFFAFGSLDVFAAPLQRTEYVTALTELVWLQQVIESLPTFAGLFFDSDHVFQAGQITVADWGRGPSGPGVAEPSGGATLTQVCPACIEGGTLEFAIFPFGDNPPGHWGPPNYGAPGVTEADAFDLVRNGTSVASGQDPIGVVVPAPAGPARYQLGYAVTMSAPWWTLSTSTTTQWTFTGSGSMQGVPPPGWVCFSGSAVGCHVIDLMLPDYRLHEDLTNHVASGPTSFELGIQHVLGVSVMATMATVSVSFDGGLVWRAAGVAKRPDGGFGVTYTNPSGARTASLRIHVVDANGDALDQTILNAYAIS